MRYSQIGLHKRISQQIQYLTSYLVKLRGWGRFSLCKNMFLHREKRLAAGYFEQNQQKLCEIKVMTCTYSIFEQNILYTSYQC